MASQLLHSLYQGPSISPWDLPHIEGLTQKQREALAAKITDRVTLWLDTWITPACKKLIPELKNARPKPLPRIRAGR